MRTRILANIGNRNLSITSETGSINSIDISNFRERTEEIWNNLEKYTGQLQPKILPAILDKYPYADLFLFVSNQDTRHESDTYFEGLILQKILETQYPNLQVKIIELRNAKGGIDPTDDEALILFYRNWLNRNIKGINNDQIVFFDSGGTAQQKSSLRAVLEFEVSSQQLKQFYGKKDGSGTVLKKLERNAAEKLFQKRQLKTLIEHYNYGAARILFTEINEKNIGLELMLQLCDLLWNNMFGEIKQKINWNNFPKQIKKHPLTTEIKKIVEPVFGEKFEDSEYAYHAGWLYEKTLCSLKVGNTTIAIISLMQMIEVYCNGYITINTNFNLTDSYAKQSDELLREKIITHRDEFKQETGRDLEKFSVYVLIFYVIKLLENKQKPEANLLSQLKQRLSLYAGGNIPNKMRLDTLRNNIAHRGKGVNKDEFTTHYKDMIGTLELLIGAQKGKFDILNSVIFNLI
ncbi:MAG: hypothetical protein JJU02_08065 [Cryomorphaceae bacterium]|nr:hypothetical protein [Cryomorphaceae bacterium]